MAPKRALAPLTVDVTGDTCSEGDGSDATPAPTPGRDSVAGTEPPSSAEEGLGRVQRLRTVFAGGRPVDASPPGPTRARAQSAGAAARRRLRSPGNVADWIAAAEAGAIAQLQELLAEDGSLLHAREPGAKGLTALHAAAMADKRDCVLWLLNKGLSVDVRALDGCTSLHCASLAGSVGVVEVLLRHGSELGARDNHGNTPRDLARMKSHRAYAAAAHGRRGPSTPHDGRTPVAAGF